MQTESIALWAALVGLGAMLLDRRVRGGSGSGGGLSVTGGSVSIDARDSVETRPVWEWIGPAGSFVYPIGQLVGGRPGWDALALRPGWYYDRMFPLDQQITGAGWRPDGQITTQTVNDLWPTYWRRQILTAQEQIVASVVTVPQTIRS
jgi:hypothetical protein